MSLETNIARTFAALSATNEAILYAKSPEELYRQVCEAAFSSGDFLATAVFLLEPGTDMLRFAAGFGEDIKRLRSIDISIVANTPEGSGVCGQAFRDQKLCISNDFLNDARSLAWREGAREAHVGAAAALPLICNGRSVGVLLVTMREAGSLNDEIVSLLERMSANISYALDNFDHEAARKSSERAMRRVNRMFGALSATNEAILRARTPQELYQRVCDAAVHGGKSMATVVLLARAGLDVADARRRNRRHCRRGHADARFRSIPTTSMATGVCRNALSGPRSHASATTILSSVQGKRWEKVGREAGVVACVALPLIKGGQSIGVLVFLVGKSWAADQEIVALLSRIAENVSSALDNFDRADEKARADEQKERLTRMFAALSATNEAIMRAKIADRAVRTGVRGRGAGRQIHLDHHRAGRARRGISSTCRLKDRTSDRIEKSLGCRVSADRSRRPRPEPEPRSAPGKPCIINDYLTDQRTAHFHAFASGDGTRSGAGFPLLEMAASAVGVLLFLCRRGRRLHRRSGGTAARNWPTTSRSRSTISIAPTKRPGPTSGSNISRRTTA